MAGGGTDAYGHGVSIDERWEAVLAHDRGSDGCFVYAVSSTGVFCRPSCPARRPKRDNVAFFATTDEAEAAGYRECRRCRPRQAGVPGPTAVAVARACRLLEDASGPEASIPTLAELGRQVGLSPSHLQRSFTRLVGVSPRRYAAAARLERAKGHLRAGAGVTTALFDAGYGSVRAFYEEAREGLGMQPSTYRRGGAEQRISFTTVDSRLGRLLVATTDEGVCAVRFGDDSALAAGLAAEFPAAEIRRDDAGLGPLAARVVAAMDGAVDDLDLPLDVRATAFQLRVWKALRAIPRGQTRSYAEVARAIERPTAYRAVAGACAANPVAVLVPCHRVIGSDGSLSGYRWGTDVKRALLDAERRAVAAESATDPSPGGIR